MKCLYNERQVTTLVNIDNKDCYEQLIPCVSCSYCMNLISTETEETYVKYVYECPQCKERLELTYIPFIKNVYKLNFEKWITNIQVG